MLFFKQMSQVLKNVILCFQHQGQLCTEMKKAIIVQMPYWTLQKQLRILLWCFIQLSVMVKQGGLWFYKAILFYIFNINLYFYLWYSLCIIQLTLSIKLILKDNFSSCAAFFIYGCCETDYVRCWIQVGFPEYGRIA